MLAFCYEQFYAEPKDNRPLFLNNRLWFLLFFLLLSWKILGRGTTFWMGRVQKFFRGAPPPPVTESQDERNDSLPSENL